MTTVWAEEDEITLFKTLMRCRPLGVHQNFRMINLYMSLNPALSSSPHISMIALRQKLDSLYDMEYLQAQSSSRPNTADGDDEDEAMKEEEEEEEDDERVPQITPADFTLPYYEYHDLIEAQASEDTDTAASSPANHRDRSSPSQSVKTESVVHEEDEEEESEALGTPTKEPKKRGRKPKVPPKEAPASTPRTTKRSAATQESGAGTPGATDDESVLGAGSTRGRKTRAAPSRKSTRKK